MKTLIIHPLDDSTSFLDIVYTPIPDKTVITNGYKSNVIDYINDHERIMMMGHGTPSGLLSVGQFSENNNFKFWNRYRSEFGSSMYVIDYDSVSALQEKKENIFIWCNADQFVNRYRLKGFYTGMFISEVGEAFYCGVPHANQDMVDESNYAFCYMLAKVINEPNQVIYDTVMKEYGELAAKNDVALYNYNRLYLR